MEALYPRPGNFRALVRELDPDGVFENDFKRRTVSPRKNGPETKHCR